MRPTWPALMLLAACEVTAASPFEWKQMIVAAVDAPGGSVTRTFPADEQWVQLIRQQLGTRGPVTVTARVVERFRQEGCARVETSFKMHEARVVKTGTGLEDVSFQIQLNTCRDGMPPLEGMDLRDVQRAVAPTRGGFSDLPQKVAPIPQRQTQAPQAKQTPER